MSSRYYRSVLSRLKRAQRRSKSTRKRTRRLYPETIATFNNMKDLVTGVSSFDEYVTKLQELQSLEQEIKNTCADE